MFLKKIHMRHGTLSFQLSIWYLVLFVLTSILTLSIFYYRIAQVTMETTDAQLIEELNDFVAIMDGGGGQELITAEFDREALEEAGKDVFFRLLAADGRIIRSTGPLAGSVQVSENALASLKRRGGYIIETIQIPGAEFSVRTIYGALSPTVFFNMAVSLEDNAEYLRIFHNLLILLMVPLSLMAAVIGWLLARRALQGVEEVTRTAIEISNGSIDKRVAVKNRSYEIDCLTNTFNKMLDRIQSLIKGMREMNDNIAHDLRSPLTRIRGIAEMTLMGNKSIDDYSDMAVTTIEECDKLIEIITTMLDITETEAGVGQHQAESVDLVRLILGACELFDPLAEDKGVQLITFLPDTMLIQGDKSRLQRLVTNLLENAIKYNRHGGTVTISLNMENHQVNIQVQDTGAGIAADELSKIFERFYRCDRSRSQGGIGLGLSLAKAIANSLGGNIQVESVLNQGSLFTVSLKQI